MCGSLFSLSCEMHLHTDLCCSKSGEETLDAFLSFLLAEDDDLGLDLRFGDLLDFRGDGDGDNLDLTTSGEILKERIQLTNKILTLKSVTACKYVCQICKFS